MFKQSVLDRIGSWDEVSVEADTELYQRLLNIYGEKSVAHILPGVPLAFALQDHHSLTGSKSTHLRTQFWGVRRLYREISSAWHERAAASPDALYLQPGNRKRPFPAPPAMLRQSKPLQVDILLAADCGEEAPDHARISEYLCGMIDTGRSIGLFHWPDCKRTIESVANVFLEMALDNNLELVLPDQEVQAKRYILFGAHLQNHPPDGLPHVTGCSQEVLTMLPGDDKAHAAHQQPLTNPRELVEASGLFDPAWYLRRYSDVRISKIDPLDHYLDFGGLERREPGPDFDTSWYLSQCSRAQHLEQPPLLHYLRTGASRGCTPRCPEIPGETDFNPARPTILVCAHAAGGRLFGAERSFLDILAACNALPVNTLVSVPSMGNQDYLKALQQRAHIIFHTSVDLWHADRTPCPAAIARFENIIHTYGVDVVHVNTLLLREPLMAARRAKIPGLVHVRESLEHDPDMCASIGLSAQKIKKEVLKKADAVIANSAFTARRFRHPRATFVVGNTLDPQLMHMENPLGPRHLHVGMISSNLPKKGLSDCVKVARLLADEPRVRLHLVGPENEHTEALIKQGLPANLTVDGYAPSPRAAMEKIQVILNLSHFEETFGRTVLEAMAAKRPVIAYRWGALPELVKNGKNGFLVDMGNLRSVADRVRKLAADRNLIVSMGENGRKRAVDYLPEHVCEQLRTVYVQTIGKQKM
jgi:glycosyltransferase involved in cell wall biosynthesis